MQKCVLALEKCALAMHKCVTLFAHFLSNFENFFCAGRHQSALMAARSWTEFVRRAR